VHVSGHPRRAELADMLAWVRPRIVVPVHGEPLHLAEHAALARQAGVPQTILCRDGDMVRLGPGEAGIIDEIPVGRLYQDGRLLVGAEARTVPDRRRLGFAGIVSVALAISDHGDLAADPEIELTGLPDTDAEGRLLADITSAAIIDTFENLPRPRRRDPEAVAEAIRRTVRSTIGARWGKKPLCHVHVLAV
jgi:ribonuclease J